MLTGTNHGDDAGPLRARRDDDVGRRDTTMQMSSVAGSPASRIGDRGRPEPLQLRYFMDVHDAARSAAEKFGESDMGWPDLLL